MKLYIPPGIEKIQKNTSITLKKLVLTTLFHRLETGLHIHTHRIMDSDYSETIKVKLSHGALLLNSKLTQVYS